MSNEPSLGFAPIRVYIHEPGERLPKECRVNYAKLTTVEYSVKVLFIGRVVTEDWDIVTNAVDQSWRRKRHQKKQSKEEKKSRIAGCSVPE